MGKDILEDILQKEKSILANIKNDFEWLHENPELAYEEYNTTEYIKEQLLKENITVLDLHLETGLVAQIDGGQEGSTIALRCDIDALPIQEESGLEYASKKAGLMHACGHDFHTAVMLGVAKVLNLYRKELKGSVKIIFQPAEEAPGGATKILEKDVLEDVKQIWGIHTAPGISVGTLAISEGAVMAAVDRFEIHVQGTGTHAAHPEEGIDPIVVMSAIVQSVQTIVSRNMNPFHANLISITRIESGNTWNVISEKGFMEGTVRTLDVEDRQRIRERLSDLASGIAKSYGAEATLSWYAGPPAVYNEASLCDFARKVADKIGAEVTEVEKSLGGEDFSLYQEKVAGAYIKVGTGGEHPIHHPAFIADQGALIPTVRYFVELAKESLNIEFD
ncbi:amidohydrolase [Anaerosporobacter sp.]|uniref:amidohydrolase n=1 Tax=Anaerosporobacter sp. TaxID=1872529 RepID=UPI00286F9ADE|nr:amidohydrolase [Anaerosporobacter sp.]